MKKNHVQLCCTQIKNEKGSLSLFKVKIALYFFWVILLGTFVINAGEGESPTSQQQDPHRTDTPMPSALLVGSIRGSNLNSLFEPRPETPSLHRLPANSLSSNNNLARLSPITPQSVFPPGMNPNDSMVSVHGSATPTPQTTPDSQNKPAAEKPESIPFDRMSMEGALAALAQTRHTFSSGLQASANPADSLFGLSGSTQSTISTASNTANNSAKTTPTSKTTPAESPETEDVPPIARAAAGTVVAVGSKRSLQVDIAAVSQSKNIRTPKPLPPLSAKSDSQSPTSPDAEKKSGTKSPTTHGFTDVNLDGLTPNTKRRSVHDMFEESQSRNNLPSAQETGYCCWRKIKQPESTPQDTPTSPQPPQRKKTGTTPTTPRQNQAQNTIEKSTKKCVCTIV